jgi:hypothetical protein
MYYCFYYYYESHIGSKVQRNLRLRLRLRSIWKLIVILALKFSAIQPHQVPPSSHKRFCHNTQKSKDFVNLECIASFASSLLDCHSVTCQYFQRYVCLWCLPVIHTRSHTHLCIYVLNAAETSFLNRSLAFSYSTIDRLHAITVVLFCFVEGERSNYGSILVIAWKDWEKPWKCSGHLMSQPKFEPRILRIWL